MSSMSGEEALLLGLDSEFILWVRFRGCWGGGRCWRPPSLTLTLFTLSTLFLALSLSLSLSGHLMQPEAPLVRRWSACHIGEHSPSSSRATLCVSSAYLCGEEDTDSGYLYTWADKRGFPIHNAWL